jgi:hypothetical protein
MLTLPAISKHPGDSARGVNHTSPGTHVSLQLTEYLKMIINSLNYKALTVEGLCS